MQTKLNWQQQHMDLVYSEQFDIRKGNILEVNDDFLQFIDSHQEFVISGNIDDDMIVSTEDKTYKLRGINLPTTLLAINQQGRIQLQVSSYIKLQDYNQQYHKIYQTIKHQSPQDDQFERLTYQELVLKYGWSDNLIRERFRISLREFNKFEEFVDFIYCIDNESNDGNKLRVFIPLPVLLKYMRNLMMYLTENSLIDKWFTQQQINSFDPQIQCFSNNELSQSFFKLIVKKFNLLTRLNHNDKRQQDIREGMQVEGQQKQQYQFMGQKCQQFKVAYQSVVVFVILQLAIAKQQYISKQMDELIKDMLSVYIPLGMTVPQQQQRQSILRRVISRHFIQTTRNNTLIRFYYDPLQIQSSLKGRIKFMSGFKNKFTRDQIRGVFEGMVLQDTSKEIKQLTLQGRKSIDMDDLLLKNFRKFNQLYEIKLILPK